MPASALLTLITAIGILSEGGVTAFATLTTKAVPAAASVGSAYLEKCVLELHLFVLRKIINKRRITIMPGSYCVLQYIFEPKEKKKEGYLLRFTIH